MFCESWYPCCDYQAGYVAGYVAHVPELQALCLLLLLGSVLTLYGVVRLALWRRTPWKW
jgi:hypothetical protein